MVTCPYSSSRVRTVQTIYQRSISACSTRPPIVPTMYRIILLALALSSVSLAYAQVDQTVFLPSSVVAAPETGPYETFVNHCEFLCARNTVYLIPVE